MYDIKSPSSVSCEARGGKKRLITKEEAKRIYEEEMKEAKRMRLMKGDFSKYDDLNRPFSFTKEDGSVYRNKAMIQIQKADAEYRKNKQGLTPFDAIPRPPNSLIIGGAVPLTITNTLRPILIQCSELALIDFNNKEGTNFVFANLVKSCKTLVSGYVYYITFEANYVDTAAADTRNNAATRTFQAEVYVPRYPKNAEPVVKLCRMKPT